MLLDDRKPEIKLEPELDEVGLLLTLAAENIRVNGWLQDELEDRGRTCALGALRQFTGPYSPLYEGAVRRLLHHLGHESSADLQCAESAVATWNDCGVQTACNVIETLREAAFATR